MGKNAHSQRELNIRLNEYAATVRTPAIANVLKRSAERWPVYAAVTGAAMAMASNASASIIHGGFEQAALANGSRHFFDTESTVIAGASVPLLGGARLSVGIYEVHSGFGHYGAVRVAGGVKLLDSHFLVKRLSSGAKISTGVASEFAAFIDIARSVNGRQTKGWSRTTGFAGFEFSTISDHHKDFGWVELQYTLDDEVSVIEWAYDNTGAAILAGEEVAVAPAPEPSSVALMLLAAGAAGVGALRRRRKTDASTH